MNTEYGTVRQCTRAYGTCIQTEWNQRNERLVSRCFWILVCFLFLLSSLVRSFAFLFDFSLRLDFLAWGLRYEVRVIYLYGIHFSLCYASWSNRLDSIVLVWDAFVSNLFISLFFSVSFSFCFCWFVYFFFWIIDSKTNFKRLASALKVFTLIFKFQMEKVERLNSVWFSEWFGLIVWI